MSDKVRAARGLAIKGDVVGVAAAVAGAALFSTKPIFIKFAYVEGIDALTLLTLRMVIAFPIYLTIGLLVLRRARDLDARLLVAIAGNGMLGYYVASFLDFMALEEITAQLERLVLFTYPLFVVILGALFFGLPFRRLTIPALLAAYAGLALVFLGNMHHAGSGDIVWGSLLVLGAALAFALFQLFGRKLVGRVGATLYTSVAMGSAGCGLLLHYGLSRPLSGLAVSDDLLLIALAIAVVSTVLPSYLLNFALGRIGADGTAMVGNAGPLFTIALSATLLGEPFGLLEAAGTCLVLFGMWLFARR
ncbi:MAG: DMT family transporter [Geminicoccaceae bacterium]|nr:DMT family transporter [Geminicoccaceae bacterium]